MLSYKSIFSFSYFNCIDFCEKENNEINKSVIIIYVSSYKVLLTTKITKLYVSSIIEVGNVPL